MFYTQKPPFLLSDLFKVRGVDYEDLSRWEKDMEMEVYFPPTKGERDPVRIWCDLLENQGAQVWGWIVKRNTGYPALTCNRAGRGKAIYVASLSHKKFYLDMLRWLSKDCGLEPLLKNFEGLEVTERVKGRRNFLFVLNQGGERKGNFATLKLSNSYRTAKG